MLLVFDGKKIVTTDLYEFIWNFDHFENILIFLNISKLFHSFSPCPFRTNNEQ